MATVNARYVSLFRIEALEVNANNWAVYDYGVTVPLNAGAPRDVVEEAIRAGRLPAGGGKPSRPSQLERYLDIAEARASGRCTYVFHLNAEVEGEQRLEFVPGHPFIPLPLNSESGESFLTDFNVEYGTEGRWASFECDLDAVQTSRLAERIRDHSRPLPVLTIPFCLNVSDPHLGASPWVVPRFPRRAGPAFRKDRTHGGIHPTAVSYLSIPL
jgi:hypothetical protein